MAQVLRTNTSEAYLRSESPDEAPARRVQALRLAPMVHEMARRLPPVTDGYFHRRHRTCASRPHRPRLRTTSCCPLHRSPSPHRSRRASALQPRRQMNRHRRRPMVRTHATCGLVSGHISARPYLGARTLRVITRVGYAIPTPAAHPEVTAQYCRIQAKRCCFQIAARRSRRQTCSRSRARRSAI